MKPSRELVELAGETEWFGLFYGSGVTAGASLVDLGEEVAQGVGAGLEKASTGGAEGMARLAASLYNAPGETSGWWPFIRLDFETCHDRWSLSPVRLLGSDTYFKTTRGKWTHYIGSPDLSSLLPGTWSGYVEAMTSGSEGCEKAIRKFKDSHTMCK